MLKNKQWLSGLQSFSVYLKNHKALVVGGLTGLICLYVVLASLPYLFNEPVGFDGAIDLQASVNIVNNGHYASFGALQNGQDKIFDPGISTGPSVLLPIALVFKIFGVGVVQARIVMLIFYLATICLISWYVYMRSRSWLTILAPLSLLLVISSGINFRLDILGEMPAAVFAIGSMIAWEKRKLGLAGVLASLAILCKFLMIFLLLGGFACLALDYLLIKKDRKQTLKHAIRWAVGGFTVLGLWELLRSIQTGGLRAYRHNLHEYLLFIKYNGSGLGDSGSRGLTILKKSEMMMNNLSMSRWTMIVLLPVLAYLIFSKKPDWRKSLHSSLYPLAFMVLYLGWWLFISNGSYTRYTVPLVVVSLAVILASALEPKQNAFQWIRPACLAALSISVAITLIQNYYPYKKPVFLFDLHQQQAIATRVIKDRQGQLTHYGFWQNPEILLLANLHSLDIHHLPDNTNYSLLLSPTMRDIVPADYQKAQRLCQNIIFSDSGYIYCSGTSSKNFLVLKHAQ